MNEPFRHYHCVHCDRKDFANESEFWSHLATHHTTVASGVPTLDLPDPTAIMGRMMSDRIEQLETECRRLRERLDKLEGL